MSNLYPFRMSPAFDPRPWGTRDLSPIYPNQHFDEKIGESWLTGDHCQVANGPLQGRSLAELSDQYGPDLVGDAANEPNRFPLLLKFLFPHEKLSVQVHPDDEAARQIGQPWGKNECWYVAHAKPGAQVALGLKTGVTKAQFERAIHDRHAEDLLNWIDVLPGDMIYVAGGTVHTLGPGAIIVETQQQSDTTFRLYDYGRPRELHLRQGFSVMKEQVSSGKVVRTQARQINGDGNCCSELVTSPYFVVEMFCLKHPYEFRVAEERMRQSVQILVAIEGCGVIEAEGIEPLAIAKGDAVVIPAIIARFQVRPQWTLEFLKSSLPVGNVPEPVTTL